MEWYRWGALCSSVHQTDVSVFMFAKSYLAARRAFMRSSCPGEFSPSFGKARNVSNGSSYGRSSSASSEGVFGNSPWLPDLKVRKSVTIRIILADCRFQKCLKLISDFHP